MEIPKNMHPKLWNVDEILSDNYRFLYLGQKDYRTQFIDTDNLKLERFKFTKYNYPLLFKNISHISKFEFPITKKNKIEVNQFKRKGEIYNSILEIVKYPNDEAVNNITDPINVNQIFKTLLSEFIIKDRTRNIIIPILNTDISGSELKKYIPELDIDEKSTYSVQVIEKYGKIMRLSDFMKNNKELDISVIKYILYQVIDCITKINETYPGFHYNNMDFDSLDCYIIKYENMYVPEIKLSYFYFSEIEKIIKNSAISEVNMQYYNVPYCDIFYFFKDFYRLYFDRIQSNEEAIKFFERYFPNRIRNSEYFNEETWNLLSDSEKSYLNIRSIRNDEFLGIKAFINKLETARLNKNPVELNRNSKYETVDEVSEFPSELQETETKSDIVSINRVLNEDLDFTDDELSTDELSTDEEPAFVSINEKYNKLSDNKLSDNNIKNMSKSNIYSGKRYLNKNKDGKLKRTTGLDLDLDLPVTTKEISHKPRNRIAEMFGVPERPTQDLSRNYDYAPPQRDQQQMTDMNQKFMEMMPLYQTNQYPQNVPMMNPNQMLVPSQQQMQYGQYQQPMMGGKPNPFFFQQ